MPTTIKKFTHWLPRILALSLVTFLSIFALDVFIEYETISEIAIALIMHLIPTFFLVIVTVIAWHRQIMGGVIFVVLGIFSILFTDAYEHVSSFMLITVLPLAIGFLFLLDGVWIYPKDKNKLA